MKKLIINFTPTGVIPTKEMTPYVPLSPEEIANDVEMAYNLGASMVHIHARDKYGNNTMETEKYGEIIKLIRNKCPDIIICTSLSGRVVNTLNERIKPLLLDNDLKPDMASLTLSSMNFSRNESINSPNMIIELLHEMNKRGIKPELEVFDSGMINYAKYLINKGLIKGIPYFNIITGNLCTAQDDLIEIGNLIRQLPQGSIYSLAGIGNSQAKMNALAVIEADGVRVGLEDNIFYDLDRKYLATNKMLIERVVKLAQAYNREIATPTEVRKLLGLPHRVN